jgi:uncharacterized protein YkwD
MKVSGMNRMAAALALAGLIGCAACGPAVAQPAFYNDLGSPGAVVDSGQARAMISAYRLNAGLGILSLDPALSALAKREADAMARADRPASADTLKARFSREGVTGAQVNVSAGYRRLAEAFSGWRDSPQHDRVMKARGATRMGIATAYAPGSKYQVYWVLVMGE